MAETLKVQKRDSVGKRNARRMRTTGQIPAVLYGHGLETISLAVSAEELTPLIHHGTRMITLAGAVNESAMIRELQWNTWGSEVLHVDFTRISADETVEVTVSVELRGEAPGMKAGGVVEHLLHEVLVECLAAAMPEKLEVTVNELQLGDVIAVKDLELPQGVKVVGSQDAVVVQCVEPVEAPEAEELGGPAEPEVIGAKPEEEGA